MLFRWKLQKNRCTPQHLKRWGQAVDSLQTEYYNDLPPISYFSCLLFIIVV